jgi:hypothetical protein
MTRASRLLAVAALVAPLLAAADPAAADGKRWFDGRDKVYIRQHTQFVRIQEPDVHLSRARNSFLKDHAALAADELEKAAAGFAYFADRAVAEQREELELAARALEKLADDVRAKRAGEITNFDRALVDAKRILAGEPPPAPPKTPDAG